MFLSLIFLFCFNATYCPQFNVQPVSQTRSAERSSLTGVYRIDIPASDKLYSVVAGASSNVPFGDQQRFFMDLAVRLTPPDLLAIEQHGTRLSLGSSRAPRMTFIADGVTRNTRAADGHVIRVRFSVEKAVGNGVGNQRFIFTSSGRTEDNFMVTFETIDNGKRLEVVRRISAEALDQPLVIRTIYNKISEVARWELYGDAQIAGSTNVDSPGMTPDPTLPAPPSAPSDRSAGSPNLTAAGMEPYAAVLRQALTEWITATNNRDIDKQMSFYVSRLKAYYLTRNTSRVFVREEKARVFARAALIEIRAEEPEIIFQDSGRTAIMRYRKKYRIESGRQSRRGEVIQELRWRRVGQEWRIFSERDIRVLG